MTANEDSYSIEPASPQDLAALPAIELAAAALFPAAYIPETNRAQTIPLDALEKALEQRCLWIARTARDVAVGFAIAEVLDSSLHLLEMDVHPRFGRRGIGSSLLRAVVTAAHTRGKRFVTLTTFRSLPWNEPFYAKRGFREIPNAQQDPELGTYIRLETQSGLNPALRVAMRLDLGPRPSCTMTNDATP